MLSSYDLIIPEELRGESTEKLQSKAERKSMERRDDKANLPAGHKGVSPVDGADSRGQFGSTADPTRVEPGTSLQVHRCLPHQQSLFSLSNARYFIKEQCNFQAEHPAGHLCDNRKALQSQGGKEGKLSFPDTEKPQFNKTSFFYFQVNEMKRIIIHCPSADPPSTHLVQITVTYTELESIYSQNTEHLKSQYTVAGYQHFQIHCHGKLYNETKCLEDIICNKLDEK
ncbi:hypothetical protein Anapl_17270 [Anas platyrhynchos]|uniref:Uncharacterized protein n=1 Tax=Anas platyrhynchos TaxID=8839 RepID=R0K470_ANAPL|nr:hypothetical protein Anapl_17270 [Anas platyrhynchos]